jgi:hypothetical protein
MAIWHVTDGEGRLLKILRAAKGDEPRARGLAAGKGKDRDEAFLTHDGGYSVSEVDPDGSDTVLWENEAAPAKAEAKAEAKVSKKQGDA